MRQEKSLIHLSEQFITTQTDFLVEKQTILQVRQMEFYGLELTPDFTVTTEKSSV